jgi:hypothetical protein
MQGGTTFTFVTDGIESALARAREAAGDGVDNFDLEPLGTTSNELVTHLSYRVVR